ncbi:MAG: hypothetical protein QOJ65_1104 [Fimbriimonadaceae bacterium]|jgi:hypothetical protein|nr:hypothetical protein [Fimbriimonadaceae bacterium]
MECDELLLLRGGEEWISRPELHSNLCYTMAIPCTNELGVIEVFEDGTKSRQGHVAWGGQPWFLSIRDDLLWLPSTTETWVLCLEARPIEDFEPLAGFAWRRVWQATKKIYASTVAFRITSQEELFRLESSIKNRLMPYSVRLFAFKKDVRRAFEGLRLTAETERLLWGPYLDEKGTELLGFSVSRRAWSYTVVCDDSASAFSTGDPVFCFPCEASIVFDDHFAMVAARHGLSVRSGMLTKATLESLLSDRKAKTVTRLGPSPTYNPQSGHKGS